jgi:hypothetical protein
MGEPRAPEPSELIYLPEPSWHPALIAAGLAGVFVGMFTWWPYAVVGAVVGLFAVALWIRDVGNDLSRLPRHQRITSAPIPPTLLDGEPRR